MKITAPFPLATFCPRRVLFISRFKGFDEFLDYQLKHEMSPITLKEKKKRHSRGHCLRIMQMLLAMVRQRVKRRDIEIPIHGQFVMGAVEAALRADKSP